MKNIYIYVLKVHFSSLITTLVILLSKTPVSVDPSRVLLWFIPFYVNRSL